jgi:hypothetical protein
MTAALRISASGAISRNPTGSAPRADVAGYCPDHARNVCNRRSLDARLACPPRSTGCSGTLTQPSPGGNLVC